MIGFWGYGYRKLTGWDITSKAVEDVLDYKIVNTIIPYFCYYFLKLL